MSKIMYKNILELKNLKMDFKSGDEIIQVLNGVDFSIKKGETVALVGPSGTGKSTLLQIAALLEKPKSGEIFIDGILTTSLNNDEKTKIRRDKIGFVYQFHNLLSEFSALENVMIPQLMKNVSKNEAEKKAIKLLNSVELSHRLNHQPKKLSGGEQQRVAIARALVNDPQIIIADEPTGNLDPNTADIIFSLLLNLAKENGMSMFMATHNLGLANMLDRVVSLKNGVL